MMRKLEERKWLLLGTGALILTIEVHYDYVHSNKSIELTSDDLNDFHMFAVD